jgi:hypothetical protein
MRKAIFTPVPWTASPASSVVGSLVSSDGINVAAVIPQAQRGSRLYDTAETEGNARLIASACTSYGRHCGARAVECAEGDLLGELIEAAKARIRPAHNDTCDSVLGGDNNPEVWPCTCGYQKAMDALAKLGIDTGKVGAR